MAGAARSNWSLCQGGYSAVWGEWCFELGSVVFSSGAAQTRSRARAHFTPRASGKPEVPWMCQACANTPGGISHELFTVQLQQLQMQLLVNAGSPWAGVTSLEKEFIPTPNLLSVARSDLSTCLLWFAQCFQGSHSSHSNRHSKNQIFPGYHQYYLPGVISGVPGGI